MLPDADHDFGIITAEEASEKFTDLYLPEGEPMTLTLKQLLDEVETLEQAVHIRSAQARHTALKRYEKELMPQLAKRLKRAMRLLGDAEHHFKDVCQRRESQRGILLYSYFQLIITDIEGPMAEMPLTGYPVVESVTKNCPKCDAPMTWWPKSSGWYCDTDAVFTPDRNVGPDPNTP